MMIGEAIRGIRQHRNLTQRDLDRKAKLPRGYIFKLESEIMNPNLEMIESIAAALEVEAWQLMKHEHRIRIAHNIVQHSFNQDASVS